MDKRYQVFVSSTYEDLKEERLKVMNILVQMNHIPCGMELFPADDDSAWTVIQNIIDHCDYYILILGGRYGSENNEGISYTEMEYKYAVKKKIPALVFLLEDLESIPRNLTDRDNEKWDKLVNFREYVKQNKLIKFYKNAEDLSSKVVLSLVKIINEKPGVGWIRANKLPDESSTKEILNVRRKLDSVKDELKELKEKSREKTEINEKGDELIKIKYNFDATDKKEHKYQSWVSFFYASIKELFLSVGPSLIIENSEFKLKKNLDNYVWIKKHEELEENYENLRSFGIKQIDFHKIMAILFTYGLVDRSKIEHSIRETHKFWSLTELGKKYLKTLDFQFESQKLKESLKDIDNYFYAESFSVLKEKMKIDEIAQILWELMFSILAEIIQRVEIIDPETDFEKVIENLLNKEASMLAADIGGNIEQEIKEYINGQGGCLKDLTYNFWKISMNYEKKDNWISGLSYLINEELELRSLSSEELEKRISEIEKHREIKRLNDEELNKLINKQNKYWAKFPKSLWE